MTIKESQPVTLSQGSSTEDTGDLYKDKKKFVKER